MLEQWGINMTDIEKQFAGNYVRLVNQNRQLQQAFDNSTQLNNKLHDEIRLKDKMIELMAKDFMFYAICPKAKNENGYINNIKNKALSELVAEQNKKAADNASI